MTEWIDIRDRLPTEADADKMHCIICYHIYQGVMCTGIHNVINNRFVSHWMPCPEPPWDDVKAVRDKWEEENERKYRYRPK